MKPHPGGAYAERQALEYLLANGLQAITTNYRTSFGEIDLVMKDKDALVFVEVRKRSHARFGKAIESIGPVKVRRLRQSAECFLLDRQHALCVKTTYMRRFDVIAIDGVAHNETLTWVKDAF